MMLTKTERESIIQELRGYNGNPNLLLAGEKYQYTKWEIEEILKCKNDIHYFIENYVKIVHVDRGLIPFIPWDFQNKTIDFVRDNRFVICKFPRQSGKSTTITSYILWYILFNPNVKVAILAHRADTARELFGKVRLAYEYLPKFLQAGVAPGGWNKGSIILGNGSSVKADATSGGSIRGESFNCIVGSGIIELKIDDNVFNISLGKFYEIANSSRINNINNNEILWDDINETVFKQQIYQYEKNSRNKVENVFGGQGTNSLEQRIKIKTANGWETFRGIKQTRNQKTIKLIFDNNTNISCTKEHLIQTEDGWKQAQHINSNDSIITNIGITHLIKTTNDKTQNVYDILHTSETNSFFVNNISVHNCILLDEFAFVDNNLAKEFMESVYPTISSGKTTKVIVVSCVTKDTYIFTENGPKQIKNFINDKFDPNPNLGYEIKPYKIMGMNKLNHGSFMVNSGLAETKIFNIQSNSIECSLNHKLWACKNGKYDWYEAKNLSEGDYLSVQYGINKWGNNDDISDFHYDSTWRDKEFVIPNNINTNIAYFLGLFLAEGHARQKGSRGGQVVISCGDDISKSISEIGLNYKKYDDIHYIISNKKLLEFIKYLGFDINLKAKEKIIPNRLLEMSKDNISAFLRGFFDGDGTIHKYKNVVSVISSSVELIKQIRILLMNFGILSTFTSGVTPPTKKVKVSSRYYRLEITNIKEFEINIGFGLNRKQERFHKTPNKHIGHSKDIIPYSRKLFDDNKIKYSKNGLHFENEHFSRKRCLNIIQNQNIIGFDHIISPNLKWEKIKSIEHNNNFVYDFSLDHIENDPWCHSIAYNGIIGHQTPKGMNHFYEMWQAAIKGTSEFVPIEVKWNEVPGRDEEWKKKQISNTNLQSWLQEFEAEFLGSSTTLLSTDALQKLILNQKDPIQIVDNMNIYKEPNEGHQYALCVDVSRGQGLDYHAFSVVDVTNLPYEQVLTFRDNKISPTILPTIIKTVSERYNYAHILVEISDIGAQVADMLVGDIDAENVIRIRAVPGKGQFIGFGVGGKVYNGLKTSPATKRIGCADLKTLIENNMLIVPDKETVKEFTTFVADAQSFAAEESRHDDLVMSLVLFGWLSHQRYFRQETQDIRAHLEEENSKYMETQMPPFGIIDDGNSTFYHEYE